MENLVMEHNETLQSGNLGLLPIDRAEWSEEARSAYREVLVGLDGWCREHDWPKSTNTWVAEEAVRQSWRPVEWDEAARTCKG